MKCWRCGLQLDVIGWFSWHCRRCWCVCIDY